MVDKSLQMGALMRSSGTTVLLLYLCCNTLRNNLTNEIVF